MKLRPFLLIFITLVIGIAIGFLASAQLRHKRMKPVRIYSSEERFRQDAFKFIQPTDEQIVVITPIIKKYAKLNRDLQKEYRSNFETLMQDYFAEIKPILTKEQLDHINSMQRMRNDAMKRFRPDSSSSREYRGDSPERNMHSDSSRRFNRSDSTMRYNRGDSTIRYSREQREGGRSN